MIAADDPRHGEHAGHIAGCRDRCCGDAKLAYDKRRRFEAHRGIQRKVPSWRVLRRVRALQALGWSVPKIAETSGLYPQQVYDIDRYVGCYRSTFEAIDKAFRQLSMQLPPTDTTGQRISVTRAQRHAERKGWLPPLAWDDMDDPNERPTVTRDRTWGAGNWEDHVDHAVVWRVINEQSSPRKLTRAESAEVVRILLSRGVSTFVIENDYGINTARVERKVS